MEFNASARQEIDRLYRNRSHVELTVGDLLAFARINLEGSLPYLAMCHTVHGPCEKNADSGLAWRLEKDMPISWHTGAAGAFNAFLGMDRERRTAVAAAVNYGLVNAEQIGLAMLRER